VKYLFLLVNDLNIAEDLAHDIFARIYKSKNSNILGLQFRNYIRKAARNIAIDHLRQKSREEAKQEKIIPELTEFDQNFYSSIESSFIDGELIATVHDVLDEFSEKNRKVFISRIMEKKTRKQVSEEEKISSYAVKKVEDEILYKLREKLKQYL
jgi:RNA polymerase sigma-70 factor (ECF subfamily)